jgi:SAM-dependent methyltransferase
MKIEYNHSENKHTIKGAKAALLAIFGDKIPKSVLDVGCGIGTWLKACQELGAKEIYGIDGVKISDHQLLIEKDKFRVVDITKPINLRRKYDLVLCLEVGEHLPKKYSNTIIKNLTLHGNTILFSAACPGQGGQNHVNCQWPSFWQNKFNLFGFACFDIIREKIWNNQKIEAWYRQNLFIAKKSRRAGNEPRINALIHPEIFSEQINTAKEIKKRIETGELPFRWYIKTVILSAVFKIKRRIKEKPSKSS